MKTDRIFGVVVILGALAFIASAYNLPAGNIFDKLGPKAFPIIVGTGMVLSAVMLVLRPDPEPGWPEAKTLLALLFSTIVLVGYAYSLKPLGFVVPTALAAGILSYQISPNRKAAPLVGLGFAFGLYGIFRNLLGLGLVGISDWADHYLPFVRPILSVVDWCFGAVGQGALWLISHSQMLISATKVLP